ncbi:MAG: universal stress protein, partial [Methyloligellaceae bacterium]
QILPAVAEKLHADLVVMGTVARAGIEGFLIGNTAESVLARLDCSVLAVKPPGFATPVALLD